MGVTDVDEAAKKEVKDILLSYDRTLLVADPRRCEPKKCAFPPSLNRHMSVHASLWCTLSEASHLVLGSICSVAVTEV